MKNRIVSTFLCILLVLTCFPIVVSADYTQEKINTLTAPSINMHSDNYGTYVTVVHSEDAMRHIAALDSNYWGDAEGGGTNSNYQWTGYGRGYEYDNYVQIDWRVPGGQWHYTSDWDTNLNACEEYIDDSTYFWGSNCGARYRVFRNGDCFEAEADSHFYPLKDYFDEFFDGYDYYYLFDQSKTVEFRCRYLIKETSGGYYDGYET